MEFNNKPFKFPQLDQNQARRQLELLGYQWGDNVFVRFFYPSDDPRKGSDKGRKGDRFKPEQIEAHQRAGRGVYFVINGGGHKNDDVDFGRAVFIEHDHLDKDTQRELWKTLGLPEPTFQIDTGGKSIHSYWVPSEPIPIDKWCELQRDLLEFTDGDRSIKNPARVMRLAGAWHISFNEEGHRVYNQSRMIGDSGKKYSYEELRAIIPPALKAEEPLWTAQEQDQAPTSPNPKSKIFYPKSIDEIQIPVPEAIPLLQCCRKEVREWIVSGVPQGQGRNDTAINVGLELVAVERHLQQIGQPFTDSARQLFAEYCHNSGMTEQEDYQRWHWCAAKNPTPSCGTDGIAACIRGWYKKNYEWRMKNAELKDNPKSFIPNPKSTTVTGDTACSGDSSNPSQLSLSATVTTVTAILQSGLKDYEERAQLDAVQARSLMSKASFWELVKALRCSLDEVHPEDLRRFNQLLDWHDASLDLSQILPPSLAQAFGHDAQILNIDPVSLWQYFLPAVLSLAGKRVNLDVESHTIPAIAWTCIVGESGTGKSRAEAVVLAPLKQQQIQERQRWEAQWREFQQTLKNTSKEAPEPTQPPAERKYLFEVATIQAVMRRLAEQGDNGSLWARDELAGLFKSLGQFSKRSGESEGLECLLRMWDGAPAFVERMDEARHSYVADATRLSIAGGIQPKAFRQAFKDPDDPQGLQARFLYAVPQVYPAQRVKGYCQLSAMLPPLYHWLDSCPAGTIRLSQEADRRYTQLVAEIGQLAEKSPHQAVRAWMRKLSPQLLRIALCLHLVECYCDSQRDFWVLQRDTLERAAEVCRYYQSAFQVVQEKAADSDSSSSILLKIWDLAITQPEGVSPRDIYRSIKTIGRRARELGRQVGAYTIELLSQLVEMGKGTLERNGRFYRFKAAFNPPQPPLNEPAPFLQESVTENNPKSFIQNPKSEELVTVVTEATNQASPSLEASPVTPVSPVTVPELSGQSDPVENPNLGLEENQEVESQAHQTQSPPLSNLQSPISNPTPPTLEDLKALLLACGTLAELKALKKSGGQPVREAYRAMTPEQQLRVDAVSATAVPYSVYKYTGPAIERNGQRLRTGVLVYIDPNSRVHKGSVTVPVWLMRGLELGWRQALTVSRSCLTVVEKAVTAVTYVIEGETGNLLDGLKGEF